jgi:hypothetical protein
MEFIRDRLSYYGWFAHLLHRGFLNPSLRLCSNAIYHAPSWLSAFGTPGPPLRGRGQIGPLGLLVGVLPIGFFSSHRIKNG